MSTFGVRILNDDGNVCVDGEHPVYAILDVEGIGEFSDPRPDVVNPGYILEWIGDGLDIKFTFVTPLLTLAPPLLLARPVQNEYSTVFGGYSLLGEPGAWIGFRLSITTSHPDAKSTDTLIAYRAILASMCDIAVCIPGGYLVPGVSVRVADANGKLLFDALNKHVRITGVAPLTLPNQLVWSSSQGAIASISTCRWASPSSPNQWISMSGGIGELRNLMGRCTITMGRLNIVFWGWRYRVNADDGDLYTSYTPIIYETRVPVTVTLKLPVQ